MMRYKQLTYFPFLLFLFTVIGCKTTKVVIEIKDLYSKELVGNGSVKFGSSRDGVLKEAIFKNGTIKVRLREGEVFQFIVICEDTLPTGEIKYYRTKAYTLDSLSILNRNYTVELDTIEIVN